MTSAPIPPDETARLQALASYELQEPLPDTVYQDLVRSAAEVTGTPTSFLSLVGEDREWLIAKQGIEVKEVPRELSFCAYAILDPTETMVVPDARYDERFQDNPLVTGETHIVFYAGVPVVDANGHALGALTITDSRPRVLSEEKLVLLKALAQLVVSHFELRKMRLQVEDAQHGQQKVVLMLQDVLLRAEEMLKHDSQASEDGSCTGVVSTMKAFLAKLDDEGLLDKTVA